MGPLDFSFHSPLRVEEPQALPRLHPVQWQHVLDRIRQIARGPVSGSSGGALEPLSAPLNRGAVASSFSSAGLDREAQEQITQMVVQLISGADQGQVRQLKVSALQRAEREAAAQVIAQHTLEDLQRMPLRMVCRAATQCLLIDHVQIGQQRRQFSSESDPLEPGSAWIQSVERVMAQEPNAADLRVCWEAFLAHCRDPQERAPYFAEQLEERRGQILEMVCRWRALWDCVEQQMAAERVPIDQLDGPMQLVQPSILLREMLEMWRFCLRRWTEEIEAVELRVLRAFPEAAEGLPIERPLPLLVPVELARQIRTQLLKSDTAHALASESGLVEQGIGGQDSHFQKVLMVALGRDTMTEVARAAQVEGLQSLSQQEQRILRALVRAWNPHKMFWDVLESSELRSELMQKIGEAFTRLSNSQQQSLFDPYLQRLEEALQEKPEIGFSHPLLEAMEDHRRVLEQLLEASGEAHSEGEGARRILPLSYRQQPPVQTALRALKAHGLGDYLPRSLDWVENQVESVLIACTEENLSDHEVVETAAGYVRCRFERLRATLRGPLQGAPDAQRMEQVLAERARVQQRLLTEGLAPSRELQQALDALCQIESQQLFGLLLLEGIGATLRSWSTLKARLQRALFQASLFQLPDPERPEEGLERPVALSPFGVHLWLILCGLLEIAPVAEGQGGALWAHWTHQILPDCLEAIAPHLGRKVKAFAQNRLVEIHEQVAVERLQRGFRSREILSRNPALARSSSLALQLVAQDPQLFSLFDRSVQHDRAVAMAAVCASPLVMASLPPLWRRDRLFWAEAIHASPPEAIVPLLSALLEEDLFSGSFWLGLFQHLESLQPDRSACERWRTLCLVLPPSIRDDEAIAPMMVRMQPALLTVMSLERQKQLIELIWTDPLMLARAQRAPLDLCFLPDCVRSDRQFLRRVLACPTEPFDDSAFGGADSRLIQDPDWMLEVARLDGRALLAVADFWCHHPEILLEAARSCPQVVCFADRSLLEDPDWVGRLMETQPASLLYLPLGEFHSNQVEEAISSRLEAMLMRDGLMIREISPDRRTDEQIQRALCQNGLALAFLDDQQRARPDFVALAQQQNPFALLYAAREYRENRDCCQIVFQQAAFQIDAWMMALDPVTRGNPVWRAQGSGIQLGSALMAWEEWDSLAESPDQSEETREVWRAILLSGGSAFCMAPLWVRRDPLLALEAIRTAPGALVGVDPLLFRDPEWVRQLLELLMELDADPSSPTFDLFFPAWIAWSLFEADPDLLVRWVNRFPEIFEMLPRSIREAPVMVELALSHAFLFSLVPPARRQSREAVIRSCQDGLQQQLRMLPAALFSDWDGWLSEIAQIGVPLLSQLPTRMRGDREVIRTLAALLSSQPGIDTVQAGVQLLRTMDQNLRSDRAFVEELAAQEPRWLIGAADSLIAQEPFLQSLLCQHLEKGIHQVALSIQFFLMEPGFWIRFFQNASLQQRLGARLVQVLVYAPGEIRSNRDFFRAMVQPFPQTTAWASSALKGDRELGLDLLSLNSLAWEHLSPAVRTEEFAFQALQRNSTLLALLSPQWRHNDELVAAAYSHDPASIVWAAEPLQQGERYARIQQRAESLRAARREVSP